MKLKHIRIMMLKNCTNRISPIIVFALFQINLINSLNRGKLYQVFFVFIYIAYIPIFHIIPKIHHWKIIIFHTQNL